MQAADWNRWASDFTNEVCDIISVDADEVIRKEVQSILPMVGKRQLIDLGCGRGTFLARFGGRFEKALGVDFSPSMLALTRRRCRALRNLDLLECDVRRYRPWNGQRADLAVCFNVVTFPENRSRNRAWKAVAGALAPTGHALIVVPSFESAEHVQCAARARRARPARRIASEGMVRVDGVNQRFYRLAEAAAELARHGLKIVRNRKVPFRWAEEGLDGRQFRGVERPWDWLLVARPD